MKRVVITGMGAITPLGISVDTFWEGIKASRVGISEISSFDSSNYKAHVAAQVDDFKADEYMDFKSAKRMERFCQFAVAAAKEALEDAGVSRSSMDPYRIGTAIGSGIGGLEAIEREHVRLLEKGPGRINPLLVPMMISNMAAGNVAIQFGLKGKSINVVTACATGTNCIGEAYRSIQLGEVDIMVAGGTESSITPIGVGGFCALTALSSAQDPLRASLPFDQDRSGFVMGEGAGILILEELEHAKKRNAKIYAELTGYGCTSDAFHITSPAEDGSGAAMAMQLAMKEAGIEPCQVDYINAHGTGTHLNDLYETRAIKKAMKEAAGQVKISSTKSMIGHLLGAAGAVEAIVCVKSIQDGYIHENVGLQHTEDEMNLSYVKDHGLKQEVHSVLSNSLGFGGHNATLLFQKYTPDMAVSETGV